MPGKTWGKFEDFQDGFDAVELSGPYVAYSMTKDGSNDNYWAGADCKLNDGWVLFPWALSRGMPANIAHEIFNVSVREVCSRERRNSASAAWHWLPEKIKYTAGQELESISTHHFSHSKSTESTSFELNYYTREYGATRWEAWTKCESANTCTPATAANVCNGAKVLTINSARWRRAGCRDWTVISRQKAEHPTFWVDLVKYRKCLYGTGRFGDGTTCLN